MSSCIALFPSGSFAISYQPTVTSAGHGLPALLMHLLDTSSSCSITDLWRECTAGSFSNCFCLDLDARPWDFQAEEVALRTRVERYNARRYGEGTEEEPANTVMADVLVKLDNNPLSCMGQHVALPQNFKENYESWLHSEVFARKTCLPDLDEQGLLVKGTTELDSDKAASLDWMKGVGQ